MIKKLPILLLLFIFNTANSQFTNSNSQDNNYINRWAFDVSIGQSKGINPYTAGYFSSNPDQYFGSFSVNHANLAARYMFSPKMGLKFGVGFDQLKNNTNSLSKPFKMNVTRFGAEGVINLARLFDIQTSLNRIGLLFHAGLEISVMTPKYDAPLQNFNVAEYNGGIIYGITPTYRITDKIALFGDLSFLNNYRQHYAWDGAYSYENNNLSGALISYSGGMSISIGDDYMHTDWAQYTDLKSLKEEELEKRIAEIETLMNDADKDGVPDYLDQENNSTAGVLVDSRGKMVDLNSNGIPDEMEKFMDNKFSIKSTENETDMVRRYINDGYISVYFDTNVASPTNVSTQGLNFMLTYLKNNPTKTVTIIGFADEIGVSEKNELLSSKRSQNVKDILIKAGIAPERLNIKGAGEDGSVDINSEGARKLVRKVTFLVD